MSILSDAWRRSRGEEEAVSRALGAPPLSGVQRRGRILPWALCAVLVIIVGGLSVYVWRIEAMRGGVASSHRQGGRAMPSAAAVTADATQSSGLTENPPRKAVAAKLKIVNRTQTEPLGRQQIATPGEKLRLQTSRTGGAQTVPDAVRAALPPLVVAVHVWNPQPSARFVIVGGHVYREGDRLTSQLRLVTITRSGLVVDFRGYLITLMDR
jgi:hypothetical protein